MYLGLISHELGEPGARTRITEGFELFAQTKTRVTSVMMKVLVAERLCAEDDDSTRPAQSGQRRIRGRRARRGVLRTGDLAGARPIAGPSGRACARESLYRRALRAAGAQHAHSLARALRSTSTSSSPPHGREAEGRAHLAEVFHDDVGWTGAQPEQARARAILGRASNRQPQTPR